MWSIMQGLTKNSVSCWTNYEPPVPRLRGAYVKSLGILILACTMMLSGCGSTSSSGGDNQIPVPLSGNWQFSMSNTPDLTARSGLQGGFLLEKNGSVSGTAAYSITLAG